MSILNKRRLLPFLFGMMIFFSFTAAAAEPTANYESFLYDYVITGYDIRMTVNEDNTYDITETVTASFNVPKHGIYRKIPLRNTVRRLDGTSSHNYAKVSDITVSHEYTKSLDGSYYQLKIGSSDITLTGEQEYVISYHYNIGKDPVKDHDEFYFNLIGDEWDTMIGGITFQISMPKNFDAGKLGFSFGAPGSTGNDRIHYEVHDKLITGSFDGYLQAGEALTVRMELPEGYFVGAGHEIDWSVLVIFVIPVLCLLISFLLWLRYGRNDKIIETVEFYPPRNLNSLEIGYLYKGKADQKDVISLLIYLADKGYIKIAETEEKNLLTKSKGFTITRLKNYDGNHVSERTFLRKLFQLGTKGTVTSSQLKNHFYVAIDTILTDINAKEKKSVIFENAPWGVRFLIILLIIASLFASFGIPTLQYAGIAQLIYSGILALFYTPFFAVMFLAKMPKIMRIFWGTFTTVHACAFFSTTPMAKLIFIEPVYMFGTFLTVACIIGMVYFRHRIPKRTAYGIEMLGKIRGFKIFLETAEKNRLETLVMQDPAYFFHILPYTYALGVSDKWMKKFEAIAMPAPSWYDSGSDFNTRSFHSFMSSTMSTAQRSMTSSPGSSGSSGGSSSGGGSSGGGSGGGGGGSW